MQHRRALWTASLFVLTISSCGGGSSGTDTTIPPTTAPPASTTTSTQPPEASALATFETADGQTYVVRLEGEHLDRARTALASGDSAGIPNGVIRPGDGGINQGHDWHVIDVELVDMTVEVCDATVSYVDDLGYDGYVAQHGDRFCPWQATLLDLTEPAGG